MGLRHQGRSLIQLGKMSEPFYHGTRADLKEGDWQGHITEQLQAMLDHLAELSRLGVEAIEY